MILDRRMICVCISVYALGVCSAADWPQLLGPARNGISAETGLIDSFSDEGPDVVWRTPLGVGMSSIAIANGLAITMYQDAENQYVVALEEGTGERRWATRVGPSFENAMGNGPRATPTVDGGQVFTFSGEGILSALNADDGKLLWSVATLKELSAPPADYGMASSPLIAGNLVIVQVGSQSGTVAAFNRSDGKRAWVAGRGAAGYSSPVLMKLAGKEQVVAFVGAAVMGIDPAEGTVLWKFDYETEFNCNTCSPVQLNEDSLLISAGESHGSTVLKVTADEEAFEVTPVWASLGNESVLRAEWQTPVLHDGHLYALDNVGGAGPITNLVCVRVSDGKQIWIERRFGKSNLTLADGKLFISTTRGELVLVRAVTDGFDEVSRAPILDKMTRQAPAIANGRLYLRDDAEVVCLKISDK